MFNQSQLSHFRKYGILYTGIDPLSPAKHKVALKEFIEREDSYKNQFLQKEFGYGFEGYSYLGQTDSSNQGAEDLVSTYVMSDFFDPERHPAEMQQITKRSRKVIDKISRIETVLLNHIDLKLVRFHHIHLGHMLSANYYPPVEGLSGRPRLTSHPDVSLLTVFPFGLDREFIFETPEGEWIEIEDPNQIICFAGYLLEQLTDIKALNHKVRLTEDSKKERFSFAYFSIPKPGEQFTVDGKLFSSEDYFARYLSLF